MDEALNNHTTAQFSLLLLRVVQPNGFFHSPLRLLTVHICSPSLTKLLASSPTHFLIHIHLVVRIIA